MKKGIIKLGFDLKLILLFTIISIGAIALGITSFREHNFYRDTNRLVVHTHKVIYESERVISYVKEFATGSRGYLLTHDSLFLDNYLKAMDSLPKTINRLRELSKDSHAQEARIDSLVPLINKRIEFSQKTIRLANENKDEEARELIATREGSNYMMQVRKIIEEIQKEENRLLSQRNKINDESEAAADRSYAFLVIGILLVLLFTFFIVRNDINFRKKVEVELHHRSELYSQTLVSLGDGVIATDSNGIITFLNKAAIELTGWKQEEAIGVHIAHIFKIIHESTGLAVINPVMAAMQENKVKLLANHTILKRKDGSILYIDDSGAPIHDLNGSVIGGVLVFRDISAKKIAENDLRASEERFRVYYENSMAGILLTAPDGRILNANPSACAILGMSEKEICRLGRGGIVDVSDPLVGKFLKQRERTGKARGEMTMIRSDGTRFPVEVGSALFDYQNGEKRTCLIFEDITDRKRAEALYKQMHKELEIRVAEKSKEIIEKEERYRYALNHMMEGVQIIDFDWKYLYLNDIAVSHSTYTHDQMVGHTMMEMYPGIEKTPLFASLQQCMTLRTSIHLDTEFLYPDKTSRWLELSIQPVPEGLFVLSTDITERKHSEQKLFEQNAVLKKTNTELDRFVYSVSHDLRAPLTSLLGLIDITDRDIDSSNRNQKERLSMMKKSVNKLDSFISDILDYSRNSRVAISEDKIRFDELLVEVIENINNMALASSCKLSFNTDQRDDFVSDRRRINIILSNLISNGIKYRNEQKNDSFVHVQIKVNDKEAIIEVEDNGIGIADSDRHKIFEMFERVSTQSTGSGIGLYIVKETIDKLSGSIIVDSTIQKGSKFIVRIPNRKYVV